MLGTDVFRGMRPRIHPTLLESRFAADAQDCWLVSGAIRPLAGAVRRATIALDPEAPEIVVPVPVDFPAPANPADPGPDAPAGSPDAPSAPRVWVDGDGNVAGLGSAPADNGSAITDYDWQWREIIDGQGADEGWHDYPHRGTGLSIVVGGLLTTAVELRYRAENANGDGEWSPPGSAQGGAVLIVNLQTSALSRLSFANDPVAEENLVELGVVEHMGSPVERSELPTITNRDGSIPWRSSSSP